MPSSALKAERARRAAGEIGKNVPSGTKPEPKPDITAPADIGVIDDPVPDPLKEDSSLSVDDDGG